ncbi:hypothetical protein B296_00004922 [Ensete ventricosum]|uniref:Uncharacterized protein n=1 Tax=Ensete ventricosum TaxID=4639 RepID=A0A427B596_ENSVE|nr:hypothetical protein B296_00004922 [Ensete ventricosum]
MRITPTLELETEGPFPMLSLNLGKPPPVGGGENDSGNNGPPPRLVDAEPRHADPSSLTNHLATRCSLLYILHIEAKVSPRLGTALYTRTPGDSSMVPKGCASSLRCWLIDREPRRSPRIGVDIWSLVELQLLEVLCDVSMGVAYLWSGNIVWLAFIHKTFLFVSASFRSSASSLIVDACTKTTVTG